MPHVATLPPCVRTGADFLSIFVRRFRRDDCLLHAAAMSFYGVLCLFPIVLFAALVLGKVLGSHDQAREALETTLRNLMPEAPESLYRQIRQMAARPHAGAGGVIGLLTLVWSGSRFFDALDGVINCAWSEQSRTYFRRQLVALIGFTWAAVFCLLSLLLSGALVTVKRMTDFELLGVRTAELTWIWRMLGWLGPFTLSVLMFYLILWLMPVGHMPARIALTCSTLAAAAWELSKVGFARFVKASPHYGLVYGSLAGTVLAMVWIYISTMILLGAVEAAGTFLELHAANDEPGKVEPR